MPLTDHRFVHTDGIASELTRRGYKVDVIVQATPNSRIAEKFPYTLQQISGQTYSVLGQFHFFKGVSDYIGKVDYDVIHAKNPFSSIFPVIFRRNKMKTKLVYDIRGLWIDFAVHSKRMPSFAAPVLKCMDLFCINKSDRTIVISEELRDILVSRGARREKIDVIVGDGVDTKKASLITARPLIHFSGSRKVLGYVGTISRSRKSERVLQAFDILKRKLDTEFFLIMVGPFSSKIDSDYFHKLVRELRLEESVLFTGPVPHDEALEYMKSFDIALAYHEGDFDFYNVAVPTKILEYLATGCAIVATKQKMYQNLLTHEKNAYLTSADAPSFADGLMYLVTNHELTRELRRNALVTAQNYSFEKIVDQIEKTYECAQSG